MPKWSRERSLSPGQVRSVLGKLALGQSKLSLAKEYRVSDKVIYCIERGITYKDVER